MVGGRGEEGAERNSTMEVADGRACESESAHITKHHNTQNTSGSVALDLSKNTYWRKKESSI